MKYATSGLLAITALSSGVYAAPQAQQSSAITMNTPTNVVTCQPIMLTWSGGTAPYFLSLQDGNNFGGAALQLFPQQSTTSTSWTVTVPAGKSIGFLLRDSAGQTSVTAPVVVQKGPEETCVDNNLSFAPASGSTSAAAGGAATVVGGASNTAAVGGVTQAANPPAQSQAATSGSSPSKSAAVASTSSNAAPKLAVSGVVLPALAALFGVAMA